MQAKYTEEQRAVTLAYYQACGQNQTKAAKDCSVPRQTLQRWLAGGSLNPTIAAKTAVKKGELADECEKLAWMLLAGIDDADKIAASSVNVLSVAFGTLVDKMRLLREQPTEHARSRIEVIYADTASDPAETAPRTEAD